MDDVIAAIIGAEGMYHSKVRCGHIRKRGLPYGPYVVTEAMAEKVAEMCTCWRLFGYVVYG